MRRESSTVVVLVGEVDNGLLAELARLPNVSVARAPVVDADRAASARPGWEAAAVSARPGWEAGAGAMREAARRRSTYVIVADDPLTDVAAAWQAMWDLSAGPGGATGFEERAAEALAAWQDKRFELPDYYLVVAPAQPEHAGPSGRGGPSGRPGPSESTGPDFYFGPLRALRPRRVVVAMLSDAPQHAARVGDALRALEHGPWWPPLDEILDGARHFYAGGLAETQLATS